MKSRECVCGRGEECRGVSAAFYILDDPRSGYTQVPAYRSSPSLSRMDVETNQLRHALLRQLIPFHKLDSMYKNESNQDESRHALYIANHHFHPKIVQVSSKGIKCTLPISMSRQEMVELGMDTEKGGEPVLDPVTLKPTGDYYVAPNYRFEKVKKQLKKAAKQKRKKQTTPTKRYHKRKKQTKQKQDKDELIGMIVTVVEKPAWEPPIEVPEPTSAAAAAAAQAAQERRLSKSKPKKRKTTKRSPNKSPKRPIKEELVNYNSDDNIYTLAKQIFDGKPSTIQFQNNKESNVDLDGVAVVGKKIGLKHGKSASAHERRKERKAVPPRMRYTTQHDDNSSHNSVAIEKAIKEEEHDNDVLPMVPSTVLVPPLETDANPFKSYLAGSRLAHTMGLAQDSVDNDDNDDDKEDDDTLGMKMEKQAKRMKQEMKQLKRYGGSVASASACSSSKSKKVRRAVAKLQQQLEQMEQQQQMYLLGQEAQQDELLQLIEGVGRPTTTTRTTPFLSANMSTTSSAVTATRLSSSRYSSQQQQQQQQQQGKRSLGVMARTGLTPLEEETKTSNPTMGENLERLQEQLQDMELEQQQYLSSREAQKRELLHLIQGVEQENTGPDHDEKGDEDENDSIDDKKHQQQESALLRPSQPNVSITGRPPQSLGAEKRHGRGPPMPYNEPMDQCGRRGKVEPSISKNAVLPISPPKRPQSILKNSRKDWNVNRDVVAPNSATQETNSFLLHNNAPRQDNVGVVAAAAIAKRNQRQKRHAVAKPPGKRPSAGENEIKNEPSYSVPQASCVRPPPGEEKKEDSHVKPVVDTRNKNVETVAIEKTNHVRNMDFLLSASAAKTGDHVESKAARPSTRELALPSGTDSSGKAQENSKPHVPHSNLLSARSERHRRLLSTTERGKTSGLARRRAMEALLSDAENRQKSLAKSSKLESEDKDREVKRQSITHSPLMLFEPSVVRVQSFARLVTASSMARRRRRSIIRIQSVARGISVRKELRIRRSSVIAVQSIVRGYQTRTVVHQWLSAILIQSCSRRFLALTLYQRQREACIEIQSAMRGMIIREDYLDCQCAATEVQAWVRRHAAMTRYESFHRGTILFQAAVRGVVARNHEEREWAACLIQSVVREFLSLVVLDRESRETSSVIIQSATRGALARIRLDRQHEAAIIIQSAVIRFLIIRRHERILQLQESACIGARDIEVVPIDTANDELMAAVALQSFVRAFLASASFRRQREASIKIQSATRGMLGRKRVDQEIYLSTIALQSKIEHAIVLQSAMRAFLAASAFRRQKEACLVIQSASRGMLERMKINKLRACIVVVQSVVRKQQAIGDYRKATLSVLRLEAFARGASARKSYLRQKKAAIVIQSVARGALERERMDDLYWSSVLIQATVRNFLAVLRYQAMLNGVILLQASVRGSLERNTATEISASLIIQSVVRAFLASKAFQKQRHACIVIQSATRGMLQREQIGESYACAAITSQNVDRSGQNTEVASVGPPTVDASAYEMAALLHLQSAVRAFLCANTFRKQKSSCVTLQSATRGFLERHNLQMRHKKATMIQSVVRRYLVIRRYEVATHGITLLQATARGLDDRKIMTHRNETAILVQSLVRSFLCVSAFRRKRKASIVMQAGTRGMLVRKEIELLSFCACLIQSTYRRHRSRSDREAFLSKSLMKATQNGDSQERVRSSLPESDRMATSDPPFASDHEPPSEVYSFSRTEMHAHLLALESKRRSTYERKLESCFLRWRSSLELLRAGVYETARTERLILGSAIVNQACADAMEAIYNDVLLDDDGNAVADDRRKTQLMEERSQHHSVRSLIGSSGAEDKRPGKATAAGESGLLGSLIDSHVVLAEQFAESANFVVNEVTDEMTQFRELFEAKAKDVKEMGDVTINELKEAEHRVLDAWEAYDSVAAEELTPGQDLPSASNRRSSFGGKPAESSADLWLVEMRYRFAVAHQSSIWDKATELFQIVIKTERARRERLKDVLMEFVPRQRRVFAISASTQAQVLQEFMDRAQTGEEIEEEVKHMVRVLASSRRSASAQPDYDIGCDGFMVDGSVTSEAPLGNRLVRAAVLVELTSFRGCWQRMLAVVTVDSYLHLFVMPSTVDPALATNEVLVLLPFPHAGGGDSDDNSIEGILKDFDPVESLFLPNCTATPNDQGYVFLTESRMGRFGNPTARKLLLRTDSPEETNKLLAALSHGNNNPQSLTATGDAMSADLSEGSDHSTLERMVGETNIPRKDAFQFAHVGSSAAFASSTEFDSD